MFNLWSSVVQSLREGRIVPILGADAVRFNGLGRTAALHELIAVRLAERLREIGEPVPDPEPSGLAPLVRAVAALPQNANRDRDSLKQLLHTQVHDAHRDLLLQIRLPPEDTSLRVLNSAPLFLTTAIDAGPELALRAVGLNPVLVNVKRVTTHTVDDLPSAGPAPSGPLLYHLLGRVQGDMTFALTDDEIIESFWKLQGAWTREGTRPPYRLIDALADRDVLLLGTGFPDWLLRFLLRWTRRRAYAERPLDSFTVVAEERLRDVCPGADADLLGFLLQFPSGTWMYRDTHPAEFLARLAEHAPAGPPDYQGAGASPPAAEAAPRRGHVFISYASEDHTFARRLAQTLGRRCRIWFDEERMRGGEELRPELDAAIRQAHIVVPLVSRHTNAAAVRRVFVEEWKCMLHYAAGYQVGLRPYLIPVVIDDLSLDELRGEAAKFAERRLDLTFRYARPRAEGEDAMAAFERLIDDLHAQYQRVESVLHGLPAAS